MNNILTFGLVCLLCLPSVVLAQTWNLPDSRKNTRFTSDMYNIVRPMLSVRGFDNQNLPIHYDSSAFNHDRVYGIKQVLERAYGIGISKVSNIETVLEALTQEAENSAIQYSGLNKEIIENNASLAKTYAALALFTYIIEKNDGDPGEPNIFDSSKKALFPDMPSHADALTYLISYLTTPTPTLVNNDSDDPYKTAHIVKLLYPC